MTGGSSASSTGRTTDKDSAECVDVSSTRDQRQGGQVNATLVEFSGVHRVLRGRATEHDGPPPTTGEPCWRLRAGVAEVELNDSYQDENLAHDHEAEEQHAAPPGGATDEVEDRVDEESASVESSSPATDAQEMDKTRKDGVAATAVPKMDALSLECERHRASLLQDWEDEVMAEALGSTTIVDGVMVIVKGAVRRQHGGQGTSQTMMFRVSNGETLDLRIALPDLTTPVPSGGSGRDYARQDRRPGQQPGQEQEGENGSGTGS